MKPDPNRPEASQPVSMRQITDYRVLRASPIFSGLRREALIAIMSGMNHETWPRGYHFSHAAQVHDHFYVVIKGRVKIGRYHEQNGRELTLFLVGPGDGFNAIGLIDTDAPMDDLHYSTLDPVEVLSAPLASWLRWLDRYPPLRRAVACVARQRIEALRDLASELAFDSTKTRLIHLLLRHFDESCYGLRLIDDLPQEELANMIGSVRPVVARLLGELRREGVIESDHGRLQVANYQRLAALADRPER